MDNQFLPVGTELHFGDWDYGWESTGVIKSVTPSGRYYRVQLKGARKLSLYTVKEIHQREIMIYKGWCPIKITIP